MISLGIMHTFFGHMVRLLVLVNVLCLPWASNALGTETERPVRLVALGDSLTAGFGLKPEEAFAQVLEKALRAKGHAVEVANAGVSGDTTANGLDRLEWSVPDGTEGVILELGANDALRGLKPSAAKSNLDKIITRLKARGVEVLLAGMRAPRNLGNDYANAFDAIFPDLAAKHGIPLYPFFLTGVVLDPNLNLGDGLHPNARGAAIIAERMLPMVEELIARIKARRQQGRNG